MLAGLLVASVLAFSLTREPVFAMAGFLFLLGLLVQDLLPSKWSAGEVRKTALELVYALLLALGVWFGLQFVLGTSAPIDVVTSCSMLPNLERGDMIVVQGAMPRAPSLEFTDTVDNLRDGLQVGKNSCRVVVAGNAVDAVCTRTLFYKGRTLELDRSNDVILFDAPPRFHGLIVHRVFARVSNGTHEFYLTKGDNNLGLDQETGFLPVAPADVKGVVRGRIPLLGFLKLFLFMQFEEPPGCKQLVQGGE